MIEFDVLPEHLDGTGALLLAHDYEDVSRRTPATLDEGLAHLAGPRYAGVELDVDLKLPGYEQRAIDALRAHGLAERTLISTMEPSSLKRDPRARARHPPRPVVPARARLPDEASAQALAGLRADRLLAAPRCRDGSPRSCGAARSTR